MRSLIEAADHDRSLRLLYFAAVQHEELRSARHCPAREADCKVSQYVTKGARPLLHPARLRFISHTVLLVVRLHGLVVVLQLRCQNLADEGGGEGQCETRQRRAERSSQVMLRLGAAFGSRSPILTSVAQENGDEAQPRTVIRSGLILIRSVTRGQRPWSTGLGTQPAGHRGSALVAAVRACWCQTLVSTAARSLDEHGRSLSGWPRVDPTCRLQNHAHNRRKRQHTIHRVSNHDDCEGRAQHFRHLANDHAKAQKQGKPSRVKGHALAGPRSFAYLRLLPPTEAETEKDQQAAHHSHGPVHEPEHRSPPTHHCARSRNARVCQSSHTTGIDQ